MKNNEQALTKPILAALSILISIVICVSFYEPILMAFGYISTQSASVMLPVSGVDFSSFSTAETSSSALSEASTTEQETSEVSETEKVTEAAATTAALEDLSVQTNSDFVIYKTVSSIEQLTETPEDILDTMSKAEETAADDEVGGSIISKTYTTEGATDSFGMIYVKNTNDTQIDIEELLNEDADISINKEDPIVLIIHSHTTETYQILDRDFYASDFLTRDDDLSINVARVGDAIVEELEKAGYVVIHDTTVHDYSYSESYTNSAAAVERWLEMYPSIEIVIDVHRDAISTTDGTKYKPVTEIEGKNAAQVMIISGCQEEGNGITGFDDWEYNLLFALDLQNELETLFEGITRPLYFTAKKYVMNYTHNSILLEVGSDSSTLEEAVYAGKCVGIALSSLLDSY